jgi:hypothetical protein
MRTHTIPAPLTIALAALALAIFHSARPVAVSAQSRASLTASATVVNADAAWTGQELTEAVLGAATATTVAVAGSEPLAVLGESGAELQTTRSERDGTVVWVQPAPQGEPRALVTVAHLGS